MKLIIQCSNPSCTSHSSEIQSLHNSIINVCLAAGQLTIPHKKMQSHRSTLSIFDKQITPVLTYGSIYWGFSDNFDRIYIKNIPESIKLIKDL